VAQHRAQAGPLLAPHAATRRCECSAARADLSTSRLGVAAMPSPRAPRCSPPLTAHPASLVVSAGTARSRKDGGCGTGRMLGGAAGGEARAWCGCRVRGCHYSPWSVCMHELGWCMSCWTRSVADGSLSRVGGGGGMLMALLYPIRLRAMETDHTAHAYRSSLLLMCCATHRSPVTPQYVLSPACTRLRAPQSDRWTSQKREDCSPS